MPPGERAEGEGDLQGQKPEGREKGAIHKLRALRQLKLRVTDIEGKEKWDADSDRPPLEKSLRGTPCERAKLGPTRRKRDNQSLNKIKIPSRIIQWGDGSMIMKKKT